MASTTFPTNFVFGTATAAYQIEGGWSDGEKGWSIWDAFCHTQGRVSQGDTGDVACDHYHRFKEDVELMKELGYKNYRFSISWPRIQPTGRGEPNEEGMAFYDRLINCCLANGITPMVTLYHWDLPLALQIEHGGWACSGNETTDAFLECAKLCFQRFGDRVKNWLTFNEPWCSAVLGYGNGEHAPGARSPDGSKVYRAGHNILLAHARAVALYRADFAPEQQGSVGIALNCNWTAPKPTDDAQVFERNVQAAERAVLWNLGWMADPLYFGDYPQVMRERCGERLPTFTEDEKALLRGSADFFALNHYSTDYAEEEGSCGDGGHFVSHWGTVNKGGFWGDLAVRGSVDPSWEKTDMGWPIVPWGFKKLLLWIQARYNPPGGIFITENGAAAPEPTKAEALEDTMRVSYLEGYMAAMHEAMEEGADVRGYFSWSFMDNFEWALGYSKRFGLVHVDYDTLERTPKASAKWLAGVIQRNQLPLPSAP